MRSRAMLLPVLLLVASIGSAQDWRGGRARVDGTVKNEKGEPIQGCKVMMRWGRSSHGGPDLTTDAKGQFAIFGLVGGPWDVDFEAAGYATKKISVNLQEGARNPSVEVGLDPLPRRRSPRPPPSHRFSWAARRSRRRPPTRSRRATRP